MDEYVTKEQVIDLITRRYENPEICTAEINALSAADVTPVRHGEWIVCGDGDNVPWMCSHCGKTTASKYKIMYGKYCPNCGAKMDLER